MATLKREASEVEAISTEVGAVIGYTSTVHTGGLPSLITHSLVCIMPI